ncbi:MAG: TonB-dependent receptor [Saprospiraceae bacterium]
MFKQCCFWLLVFFTNVMAAQNFNVSGSVNDQENLPLPGATVELLQNDGEQLTATVTDGKGQFLLKGIPKGNYQLKIAFLGFETVQKELTFSNQNIQLEPITLSQGAIDLEGADVKAKLPLATQKDDTTQFNASAFKVMNDADAGDLINKIPTVSNENGTLKAQGENVGKVLVDGKPFFGEDANTALKALPAEVIEKIQIFDAQSEQSQFTGFNDGNTTKTINIVTKKDKREGQFGKFYAGYGYEDKYQAGGNMNLFKNDSRISIIGLSNNINIQNFSTDDILGVTGSSGRRGRGRSWRGGNSDFTVDAQGGISTTHALGINYTDKWGKSTDVTASYFFNNSENNNESDIFRDFISGESINQTYSESSRTNSTNTNHKLNARLDIKLDSMNSLNIRPRLTYQANDGMSSTAGMFEEDSNLLSTTQNLFNSDLSALSFSNSLLWRHKLKKEGRTFSVDVTTGFNPQNGNNRLTSLNNYLDSGENEDIRQRSTLDENSWNISGNLEYTEPINEKNQLLLNYKASIKQESSDKETFDFVAASQDYSLLNEDLSNVYSNDYITHEGGVGYRWTKSKDLFVMARLNAQFATLDGEQTFPNQGAFNQTFFNVLPFAMLRYNISKEKGIRVFYRSNTDLPSVSQLQNVLNNTNPLQLTIGNPNLSQAVQHRVFMRYSHSNVDKASTFFAYLSGSMTNDFIANAIYTAESDNPEIAAFDLQRGAQLSRPVNLDGYREFRSFISYGFPLSFIKCNLSFDGAYSFSRRPGLVDDLVNFANTNTYSGGVSLVSNISENIDFNIGFRPSYNTVVNTISTRSDNDYLQLNSSLKFNWIIFDGFVFRTDLTNSNFSGLSGDLNQNIWLWGLAIGKKVFKNERGEISLAVNDLLNQNQSISRNITETYIEDRQTNALRQFVMLSFTYNFRNFNLGRSGR